MKNMGLRSSPPALAKPLTKNYACKICLDTGFVHPLMGNGKPDYSRVAPCKCQEEEIRLRKQLHLLRLCELPAGSEKLTLDSFDAYDWPLSVAKDAALQLSEPGGLKWLVLMAGPDRGKTHLAVAICRVWLDRGEPARYAYVPLLLDELRRGFSREASESYDQQFEFFCNVPLLVLDDLGVEKSTDWVSEKLDTIVDYRYIRGLPLVVTTNKPMDELPVRIASRLQRFQPGKILVLDVAEYRLRRKP